MNHLIVGIDTGKTGAIACLDLEGKPQKLVASTSPDLAWFVEKIRELGSPVVIASDKKKNNDTAAKLASIFDAALYTPREDISVERKKELARKWKIGNIHQRDALSAAVFAYNHYAPKLNQAGRITKGSVTSEVDRIKALVIKKHSISEAIERRESGRFVR